MRLIGATGPLRMRRAKKGRAEGHAAARRTCQWYFFLTSQKRHGDPKRQAYSDHVKDQGALDSSVAAALDKGGRRARVSGLKWWDTTGAVAFLDVVVEGFLRGPPTFPPQAGNVAMCQKILRGSSGPEACGGVSMLLYTRPVKD